MVIVGGGECGARAAFALREAGYDGPVTLIGAETHLPYERPPLSKAVIIGDEAPAPKTIAGPDRFAEASIRVITGNAAVAIDRRDKAVRLADGNSIPYGKLLLATGAVPRKLPQDPGGALYLRTFEDSLLIRSRLQPGCRAVIVGGGLIGLELAASARMRGAEVVVVEAQPRLLTRCVAEPIGAAVQARHRAAGVQILCGHGVAEMEGDRSALRIRTTGGRQLDADLCVVGIGAVPATGLAEAAGLRIDNGIAVDDCLRTSDPDIFAAGDCSSAPLAAYGGRRIRLEAWRNAQEQGALAAANMLGAGRLHAAVPWFWSDQYDSTLYVAGLADEGRSVVRRDLADGAFLLFHLAEDGRLVAAGGIGPGNAVAKEIRLAEMLIARGASPAPAQLAAPDIKLKALLAA